MTPQDSLPGGFRRLHDDLIGRLRDWEPPDGRQEALTLDFLEHLARHPDAMSKGGPRSHFTASALVVNTSLDAVLLTHHRRAGLWFQFGGHFDAADEDVPAAAAREAQEESGIALVLEPVIVELSRHTLAGDFGRCHEHLDIRYVAQVDDAAHPRVSAESHDVQWWPIETLPPDSAADLPQFVTRAVARFRG